MVLPIFKINFNSLVESRDTHGAYSINWMLRTASYKCQLINQFFASLHIYLFTNESFAMFVDYNDQLELIYALEITCTMHGIPMLHNILSLSQYSSYGFTYPS